MFIDTCFYIDLMREHCSKTADPAKKELSEYTMDLLIGVLAKSHGQPVLTRNVKDFQKIPDLIVETY
jgi:hypothetical protein